MALRQDKLFTLKPGRHFDTDRSKGVPGLHLRVTSDDARSWMLRASIRGRRCEFGLGSARDTALSLARERALEIRRQIFSGQDPRAERAVRRATAVPFRDLAVEVLALIPDERYRRASQHRFEAYLEPTIGDLLVSQINSGVVVTALRPIWNTKASTATNALSFVGRVLVEARARGLRPLPDVIEEARAALGKQQDREVKRRRAMPLEEVPALMAKLRATKSAAARALEFTILTGHRSGAVLKARPEEFAGAMWTSPAEHQKSRRAFRTSLSKRAMEIVAEMRMLREPRVFPLHVNAMADLLRDLAPNCDVHGFRSVLLGWSRKAGVPRDEQGLLLQHTEKDRVRAAYARGDLLEERAPIMERWSDYCRDGQKPAKLRRVA